MSTFCSSRWVAKLAQRVRRDPLGDPGRLRRGVDGAHQLAGRHRVDRVLAREQPSLRPRRAPPVAQQFEQLRREHHIAVPLPLALLDPKRHALAVEVGHLQRHDLRHPQPSAVGDAERGLVLEAARLRGGAPPPPGSRRPAPYAVCSRSSEDGRGRAVRASR